MANMLYKKCNKACSSLSPALPPFSLGLTGPLCKGPFPKHQYLNKTPVQTLQLIGR